MGIGDDQNARELSDLSHAFIGWKVARPNEEIPYETVLIDVSPLTDDEERWVAEVAAAAG
jgi:hypothetical protein